MPKTNHPQRQILQRQILKSMALLGRSCSALGTAAWLGVCLALVGCSSSVEIRITNTSTVDYKQVTVADRAFGDIAAGTSSEYRPVELSFRYADLALIANGRRITGQTLSFGSKRFTYRIDLKDLAARQLAIEIVKD